MTTQEQPEQSYYPSARIRLIVRLEDFGAKDTPEAPTKPTTVRKGIKDAGTKQLEIVTQADGSLLLKSPGGDSSALGSPQQQVSSADQRTFALDGVIPSTATLMRNGVRTADTLSAVIKFRDMPIDPRVLRSAAVEFYMGTISAEDYQRGLMGEVRDNATTMNTGLPYQVIPDTYVDAEGRQRTNLRFQGWVDSWDNSWESGEAPSIQIECTDNTRLLIGEDAPPKLFVGSKEPLHRAVAVYLSNFPQFRGLSVDYLPKVQESEIPVLSAVMQRTAFPPTLGPPPAKGAGSNLKVWDYLTDVCGSVGHIIRVEGTRIIIQKPRTLYDTRFAGRSDDVWFDVPRYIEGQQLPRRMMIYGRNIGEMRFGRKFGEYAPQNIEVRCYSNTRKKLLVVRFPLKGETQKRIAPGEASDEKWTVKFVEGINDEKTLRLIAQSAYEQIGRNELNTKVVTKNLGTWGGGNDDPDALDMLPGDAIDVVVQRDEAGFDTNTITNIESEMHARPAAFLQELNFSKEFAEAYAKVIQSVGLQTTFRVKSVCLDWDAESQGVTVDLEGMNYVEVRANKDLEEAEQTPPQDGNPEAGAAAPIVVKDQVQ